jgi:WD40 repeat protein
MPQSLNRALSAGVLTILIGQAQGGEKLAEQADPLPAGAVARFGTSRFLNYGRVFSVAFSPDGKSLVAGSWDGVIRLWEVAGGNEPRQFDKQQGPVRSVAFSPDGKMVAAGGKSTEIVLWDAATGKELRRLVGHQAPITFVTFSPDGKLLTSKSYDQTLRLWDVVAGREVRRLGDDERSRHMNEPDCPVGFTPDGKTAGSASGAVGAFPNMQRQFKLWDVATGAEVQSFSGDRSSFGAAAFSPDGKTLAAGTNWPGLQKRIYLWDLDSGKELRPVEQIRAESAEPVSSLVFSPDGKTLASSGGGLIQLWEVATRREVCRFQTGDSGRTPLAFSPDGRLLASGSMDITVLLWDVTGRLQDGKLRAARLSPQEFEALWADLDSEDVPKARRAQWTIIAGGDQSAEFLSERLHPAVSPASAEAVAQLVVDLDSPRFPMRARATAKLAELAELAEPALRQAQKSHPSLELRQRLEELLYQVAEQRSRPTGERLRRLRAIGVLEQIGTAEARKLLEQLSQGAAGASLTREAKASLLRLGRGS